MLREYLESDVRTFRAFVKRAGLPTLLFAAGLFAGTAAIIGIDLVKTIGYILRTMVYDRDFWTVDESFRTSLLHYSTGPEGRLALGFWLWIGLALAVARVGLVLFSDRRDAGAAAAVLAAALVAYAIPTLVSVKSYFLGAIFYGVFIVTTTLNFGAVTDGLDTVISRLTIKPVLQRRLSSALHHVPLATVLLLFAANCFPGRVGLATRLNPDQIQDIRMATAKVWSLLQPKSLMHASAPSVPAGKPPLVSFSSPIR